MIGNKGCYILEVIAQGKAAHSSMPEKGENAIYKLAKAVNKIEKYNKKINKRKYELYGQATANVGTIQGGNVVNSVPEFAKIKVDRRVLPNEDPNSVEKELRELVAPLKTNIIERIEACETSKDTKIVIQMQNILKELNMNTKLQGCTGTSELSEISLHGIQGILFGTGEMGQAHVTNEYITLEELKTGTETFIELFKKWK